MADRKQGIHPISGLVDLVVLVAAGMVLPHPHDEVEDCDEGTDGVGVAPEHQVTKTNVVVRGDMTSRHPREGRLKKKITPINYCHHIPEHCNHTF